MWLRRKTVRLRSHIFLFQPYKFANFFIPELLYLNISNTDKYEFRKLDE